MDIRWKQRFYNFTRAYNDLVEAVDTSKIRELNKLEKQGLIQGFELTHELAWKVLKDYLTHLGFQDINGSKNATREAFKLNLIDDGDLWLEMIESWNLTSHTYDLEVANNIADKIVTEYVCQFTSFIKTMTIYYEQDE